jgi:hypothetical protein
VVDIAYKERKIAILLECQVKFLFLSKKSHMFTKAICKNYAISAFPGYPGIAAAKIERYKFILSFFQALLPKASNSEP